MRLINIHVVAGAEGSSLQVLGLNGGYRVAGPKAWGNPYNHPAATFIVGADELIRHIEENAYSEPASPTGQKE